MEIKKIACDFSVCKVKDYSLVDLDTEFCFTGKTDEENSLVCPEDKVPSNVTERDDGWKAFRIQGILDFSLIGILAKLASLLAEHNISIFAVSAFNSDSSNRYKFFISGYASRRSRFFYIPYGKNLHLQKAPMV